MICVLGSVVHEELVEDYVPSMLLFTLVDVIQGFYLTYAISEVGNICHQ